MLTRRVMFLSMILNGLPWIANVEHSEPTCFDLVSRLLGTCCLRLCLFDGCRNSPSCKYFMLILVQVLGSQGIFMASLWLVLLVQLDDHEGTWGQRRRRRLTRSTKHRSSSLFSPSLPVALQSGLGSEWKLLILKTRPMSLFLKMVQIKIGPIHLDHYQSHLTVHHNHIVRVLSKPFANLFIFFLTRKQGQPSTENIGLELIHTVFQ